MKKIAVVILNWNGQKLLGQFLPSVVKFSEQTEIYVADNASGDDSIDFVKAHFPAVKIIENKSNFGFARGYNEALQHIEADIFALVNSDIEVTRNWLAPILETFENDPQTAIIQPKILDYKNKDFFEYAGAAGGFIDKYGYPFCRGRIFETVERDTNQYDDNTEIFWASGACFFIRNSAFKALDGFDVDFFAHQEEIDLCWRAFNKGYKTKYVSTSTVYHVGGATLQKSNPRKTYLNFRNSLLMLTKNLPRKVLFKILFMRLLLDGIAGIQFVLTGKFSHCFAVIKAHFSFYGQFSNAKRKRSVVQLPDYFKINSIVWDYYIKKRKTFKSLFNNSLS